MPGPGSARAQLRVTPRAVAAIVWRATVAVAAGCALLVGCRAPDTAANTVTVLAAASLADALPPLLEPLNAEQGLEVRLVFAASSTLARQAEAGAPFDVFFSADERWLDHLVATGHVAAASKRFVLGNRLVVVRPGGAQLDATDLRAALAALPPEARIALGDPEHVPAGRYARAALRRLDLWSNVAPRLVLTDNVRAALALVERAEVGLGVVYQTDVALAPSVTVAAELPADPELPVRYALGQAQNTADARQARVARVVRALTDERARAHFAQLGFEPL